MFIIRSAQTLAPTVKQFDVEAPDIARRAQPGQFVVLRVDDTGERIPLTIAAADPAAGTITLIFQEIGKTTTLLGTKLPGDAIHDIVGPLGHPTEIALYGTIVAIAGGVGVAEVLPVVRALKAAGNKVVGIIGGRSKDLIILEKEMTAACDKLFVTTDDGTSGVKGMVTTVLNDLLAKQLHIDLVYAIGPVPMMRAVSAITAQQNIKTLVSLNPIMVDGTGMCGSCRVTVAGKTRFACVDGPEFDGRDVNWDELSSRLTLFRKEEKTALDQHHAECKCQNK